MGGLFNQDFLMATQKFRRELDRFGFPCKGQESTTKPPVGHCRPIVNSITDEFFVELIARRGKGIARRYLGFDPSILEAADLDEPYALRGMHPRKMPIPTVGVVVERTEHPRSRLWPGGLVTGIKNWTDRPAGMLQRKACAL